MGERIRPNPESSRESLEKASLIEQIDELGEDEVRRKLEDFKMAPEDTLDKDGKRLLELLEIKLKLIEEAKK